MIKNLLTSFKDLDNITYKIMKKGIHYCFIITLISSIILFTYDIFSLSPNVFHIGFALLKLSLYFIIEFIICGFTVDSIKKKS